MKVIIAEILKNSVVAASSIVAASAIHRPLCSLHILSDSFVTDLPSFQPLALSKIVLTYIF